jgi:splicing factor 3B subunit 2
MKRKYLQGKKGIEKMLYELPSYIADTGVGQLRASIQEKEEKQTAKAKMQAKMKPKLGRLEIDYQKLHDAFFRFQTKPYMTGYGDMCVLCERLE